MWNFCAGTENKLLYGLLKNNDEAIVRASVFNGNKSRKVMGTIMEMVKARSIHVPSTERLWRLVRGTRCERGSECYQYNLETKIPALMTNIALRPFGMCICQTCARILSAPILPQKGWGPSRRYLEHFAVKSGRVVGCDDRAEANRLLCQGPQLDPVTGDKIGPLVLGKEIKQIANTYPHPRDDADARKDALDKVFEKIDQEEEEEGHDERTTKLVSFHEAAEAAYDDFVHSKWLVEQNKIDAKRQEKMDKKVAKMRAVFAYVNRKRGR